MIYDLIFDLLKSRDLDLDLDHYDRDLAQLCLHRPLTLKNWTASSIDFKELDC